MLFYSFATSTQLLQVKFIPGEHCFLENIQIQLREIQVLVLRKSFSFLLKSFLRRLDPPVSGKGGYDNSLLCWTWALRRKRISAALKVTWGKVTLCKVVRRSCRTVLYARVFLIMVLLLLTSLLLFQRRMADAHDDEDTVIEEEYKVWLITL